MLKLNWKIYVFLLVILALLIVAIGIFSSKKQSGTTQSQPNGPTPTSVVIVPTSITGKIILTPRFTGADDTVPSPLLDFAIQKQALKKRLPLTENGFTITYDYQSDIFTVALSEPKQNNKSIFEDWLKKNYSLIPLNKFLFK